MHRHLVIAVDGGDEDIDLVLGQPLADAGKEFADVGPEMRATSQRFLPAKNDPKDVGNVPRSPKAL
jgi:hypothetical protein